MNLRSTAPYLAASLRRRFAERITPEPFSGCILWTGRLTTKGYGVISTGQKERSAHRIAYEWHFGPIPEGLQVHHKCKTRSCVNPLHMQLVTHLEHIALEDRQAKIKARTHCSNGHEYTEENTIMRERVDKYGLRTFRTCRECGRIAARNFLRRKRNIDPSKWQMP